VAVNVVDVPPLRDVRAIAAGLREHFAHLAALGPSPVLHGRRSGNVVVVGAHAGLPLERLRPALAADPSPAVVVTELDGAAPWLD
jgi:hypothetical protein